MQLRLPFAVHSPFIPTKPSSQLPGTKPAYRVGLTDPTKLRALCIPVWLLCRQGPACRNSSEMARTDVAGYRVPRRMCPAGCHKPASEYPMLMVNDNDKSITEIPFFTEIGAVYMRIVCAILKK